MNIYERDVHYLITHQLPSTLDGKFVFGQGYPKCQYGNGTWFVHDNDISACVTEKVRLVDCELCREVMGV